MTRELLVTRYSCSPFTKASGDKSSFAKASGDKPHPPSRRARHPPPGFHPRKQGLRGARGRWALDYPVLTTYANYVCAVGRGIGAVVQKKSPKWGIGHLLNFFIRMRRVIWQQDNFPCIRHQILHMRPVFALLCCRQLVCM